MQWNSVCVPEVQNRTQKWQAHGVMELMEPIGFIQLVVGRWLHVVTSIMEPMKSHDP
jgi:hypothetical protein